MKLITLAQAKFDCRIDSSDLDDGINELIERASGAVLTYLKGYEKNIWLIARDDFGQPIIDSNGDDVLEMDSNGYIPCGQVRSATSILVRKEFEASQQTGNVDPVLGITLPLEVIALLEPLRVPALA